LTPRPERIVIAGGKQLREEVAAVCRTAGFAISALSNRKAAPRPVCAFEVTIPDAVQKKKNLRALDRLMPPSRIIFTSSVTVTVDEQATWIRHPERLVGISALPVFFGNALLELAPGRCTGRQQFTQAGTMLRRLGKDFRIVQDRIGMVLPRIVCMIINEAAFALMEQVSSPQELDAAVQLGARYPFGPVELADRIGITEVIAVLEALFTDLGEDRYRVAPLLRQLTLGRQPPQLE
jgi:3-hydroxybutyryl-CoA dehydrogenase